MSDKLIDRLRELALGDGDPDQREEDELMLEASDRLEEIQLALTNNTIAGARFLAAKARIERMEAVLRRLVALDGDVVVTDGSPLWSKQVVWQGDSPFDEARAALKAFDAE